MSFPNKNEILKKLSQFMVTGKMKVTHDELIMASTTAVSIALREKNADSMSLLKKNYPTIVPSSSTAVKDYAMAIVVSIEDPTNTVAQKGQKVLSELILNYRDGVMNESKDSHAVRDTCISLLVESLNSD